MFRQCVVYRCYTTVHCTGLSAVYGFCISANYSLTSPILVELVSLEKFSTAYGYLLAAQVYTVPGGAGQPGEVQHSLRLPSSSSGIYCTRWSWSAWRSSAQPTATFWQLRYEYIPVNLINSSSAQTSAGYLLAAQVYIYQ